MTTRVPRRGTVRPVPAEAQSACGPVQATARVRLAPCLSREVFEANLRTIPAVRSAVYVIGDVDYESGSRAATSPTSGSCWPACALAGAPKWCPRLCCSATLRA